jgi:hypothetical protein
MEDCGSGNRFIIDGAVSGETKICVDIKFGVMLGILIIFESLQSQITHTISD